MKHHQHHQNDMRRFIREMSAEGGSMQRSATMYEAEKWYSNNYTDCDESEIDAMLEEEGIDMELVAEDCDQWEDWPAA